MLYLQHQSKHNIMKLHLICKYLGLTLGAFSGLLILAGVIGFFTGPLLGVANYWNYFWFAIPLLLFAMFCMLVHIGCKDKPE